MVHAQDIFFAMVITVPVVAAVWSVVADALESRKAYKDSLKGN